MPYNAFQKHPCVDTLPTFKGTPLFDIDGKPEIIIHHRRPTMRAGIEGVHFFSAIHMFLQ